MRVINSLEIEMKRNSLHLNLILLLLCISGSFTEVPEIAPTEGKPWPIPQMENQKGGQLLIDPDEFIFKATGKSCEILTKAFRRYKNICFPNKKKDQQGLSKENLESNMIFQENKLAYLAVNLASDCEEYPHLNMIEEYELQICSGDNSDEGVLTSQSIWGILRGLETFSQILLKNNSFYLVNCTQILDFPRFPHRGLLLDTSRHYLPVKKILENLELMAMNKLNVFHWHIVDDQSFPFVSLVYPNLSSKGSWSDIHVYSRKDIALVVNYARDLGIRVVPEFDTPGHTKSWGKGQPDLLTNCISSSGVSERNYGPINPSNEANFEFLKNLFQEISKLFPDFYLHLGGDEVSYDCWRSNPQIEKFMKSKDMNGNYKKLEGFYMKRLIDIVNNLKTKKGYIVWEEIFANGNEIPQNTIVQIWKENFSDEKATSAGHRVIISFCWYLDLVTYGDDWFYKFYNCDPHQYVDNEEDKKLVIGGEACMWGEYIDSTNLIPQTWPRAAPVAEKLWSSEVGTRYPQSALNRLAEHRCRLLKRGYSVAPLAPSFCPGFL
ncbi:UNVERIFIED_CONTAM: hypothetical protein RMT77_000400 [Armadillidium vulgare]